MSLPDAIIKTLAYADVFDCPLYLEEMVEFLILPDRISPRAVKKELLRLESLGLVKAKKEFWFLKGRSKIVALRKKRQSWSQRKLKVGQKIAFYLKIVPWAQAILITGALARENVDREDDIDWLIITAPRRLWLTRFLVVLFLQILGKRRRPKDKQVRDRICLNMFLTSDRLLLPSKEQNLFTAHELLQAKLLWEKKDTYLNFIKKNSWVKKYLANAYTARVPKKLKMPCRRRDRVAAVKKSFAFFFDFLEALAFCFQFSYMKPKKTIEKIEPNRALFHPQDARAWVMREYRERLGKLGINKS